MDISELKRQPEKMLGVTCIELAQDLVAVYATELGPLNLLTVFIDAVTYYMEAAILYFCSNISGVVWSDGL